MSDGSIIDALLLLERGLCRRRLLLLHEAIVADPVDSPCD